MYRVGLDIPIVEVRFEHINVEAKVYVGGRALPSLLNFYANVLEVINQHATLCFLPFSWIYIIFDYYL